MLEPGTEFRSVILAGERPGGNALSQAFNISASVMVPVAGEPALAHVMQAIKDSQQAGGGIICGPSADVVAHNKELDRLLQHPDYAWLAPATGPAAGALAALEKLDHFPALLTAGDHALLTGEIVDHFCQRVRSTAEESNYDFVIGVVPYALVQAAWPESKRTVLKFSNGQFCGSNLFAILNPEGLKALALWSQLEAERKHPWRIARRFGFIALVRYLLRRLTLEDVMRAFSTTAGCKIGHVQVNFARAAVDVDSIEDQQLAEKIMST
jgi:molybdopterin-guanine dinucleotide biosynthesis protein A